MPYHGRTALRCNAPVGRGGRTDKRAVVHELERSLAWQTWRTGRRNDGTTRGQKGARGKQGREERAKAERRVQQNDAVSRTGSLVLASAFSARGNAVERHGGRERRQRDGEEREAGDLLYRLRRARRRCRRSLPVCTRVSLLSPRSRSEPRAEDRACVLHARKYVRACVRIRALVHTHTHRRKRESRFLLIVRRPYVPTHRASQRFKNRVRPDDDGEEKKRSVRSVFVHPGIHFALNMAFSLRARILRARLSYIR